MLIGEIARATGLTTATIRYYEAEGLLAPEGRASGRRVYSNASTERLRLIAGLQAAGFSIREIRGLLATLDKPHGLSKTWHERAHAKLGALNTAMRQIRAARGVLRAMLACGCDSVADCGLLAAWRRGDGNGPARALRRR